MIFYRISTPASPPAVRDTTDRDAENLIGGRRRDGSVDTLRPDDEPLRRGTDEPEWVAGDE